MTTSEGLLDLTISEKGTGQVLYSDKRFVEPRAFTTTTVGIGALSRDALLFSMGRIPYSEFTASPEGKQAVVDVVFEVTKGGAKLKGSDGLRL